MRKTMGWMKPQLEKDGFKESGFGVYDLRDWDEIRNGPRSYLTRLANNRARYVQHKQSYM